MLTNLVTFVIRMTSIISTKKEKFDKKIDFNSIVTVLFQ